MKKFELTISLREIIDYNIIETIEKNIMIPKPGNWDRYVSLNLSTSQKNIINSVKDNNKVIIKQDRRTGVSTAINAMIACEMVMGDEPIEILFVGASGDSNYYECESIQENICSLINKSNDSIFYKKKSKNEILLVNGSSLKFINEWSRNQPISFTEPHNERNIKQWVIFNQLSTTVRMDDLYFDFTRRCKNPNAKVTIISHTSVVDNLFFPIWFLGDRIGFTRVESNLIDSHLFPHILNSDFMNVTNSRINELSSKFTIDNLDKFNVKQLIDSINKHLPDNAFFSMGDLLSILNKITIDYSTINAFNARNNTI